MGGTDDAIVLEVQRLSTLSDSEREALGARYLQPESIWCALEHSETEWEGECATKLLRASWVLNNVTSASGRFPRRGENPDAYISVSELRSLYADAHDGRDPSSGIEGAKSEKPLPIISISHFWRERGNPDPDGETFALVATALARYWRKMTSRGLRDFGIFYDFSSLFQEPRDPTQTQMFRFALRSINLWYAHKLTTVWLVTEGVDRVKGLSYWEKGWTSFEFALANMIKASNKSFWASWPLLLDLGKDGDAQLNLKRLPPTEPLAFFEGHEFSSQTYTNGADRDAIVAPKFRETTFELLAGTSQLDFDRAGWGDDDVVKLGIVLPLCTRITWLELSFNACGDNGAVALGRFLAKNASLITLNLNDNQIGAAGGAGLAEGLKENATLQNMWLRQSTVGETGGNALMMALKVNATLTSMDISSNGIPRNVAESLRQVTRSKLKFTLWL